ncbi:Other/CAMKK/ELM protein kinase [Mycena sanguinolenta]|uniref:Other/CAMKK/ELM protein kinase n=1 Tax=Mycena sanguinolenta TaxID=230812 RepID=A0A8H6ZBF8_9AGAR|nr:Other/CAMKK/ELM protein kinase [Mycena sanguinolenta]
MSSSIASPPAPAPSQERNNSNYISVRRQLGKGHNATVYLVDWNTDPIPKAMKKIARNNKRTENLNKLRANNPARVSNNPSLPRTGAPSPLVDRRGTEEAKIRREIAIMKKCDHPNIIKFFSFIDDQTSANICLILEYMEGGELQWQSAPGVPYLTMSQTRRCTRDVVLGLQYLHTQGIIHRDIKPSNIMWTADRSHVKIGDFGVAHLVSSTGADDEGEEMGPRHAGTPAFLAPEIAPGAPMPTFSSTSVSSRSPFSSPFSSRSPSSSSMAAAPGAKGKSYNPVTPAVDLWALGVTLFCMLFGRMPFEAAPDALNAGSVAAEASLYRAIRGEEWRVPEGVWWMCADRVPITRPSPRSRGDTGEGEAEKQKGRGLKRALSRSRRRGAGKDGGVVERASSRRRGDSDPTTDNKAEDSEREREPKDLEEGDYKSGEGVLDLLGGLLQKDVRKRWGIHQVKDVPWLLLDIQRHTEWREGTTPRITVSAADEANAILEPKYKWNLKTLGRRFSNFNFFRSGSGRGHGDRGRGRSRGRDDTEDAAIGVQSAPERQWEKYRSKGKEREGEKEKPTKRKTKPKSRSVDTARVPPPLLAQQKRRGSETESSMTYTAPPHSASTTASSSAAGDSPPATRRRGFFRWGRESPAPMISTPTTSKYSALGASTFTPSSTSVTTPSATTTHAPRPPTTAKWRLGLFPPTARHSTDALSPPAHAGCEKKAGNLPGRGEPPSLNMSTARAGSVGEGYWSAEGEGDADVEGDKGASMVGRGMIVGAIVPSGGYAGDEEERGMRSLGSPSGSGSACSYGSGARARDMGMGNEVEDAYDEERDPYAEEDEYDDDDNDDDEPRGPVYDSTSSGDEENVPITFKGARSRLLPPGPGNGQETNHDLLPPPPQPLPASGFDEDDDDLSSGEEVMRIPNNGPGL